MKRHLLLSLVVPVVAFGWWAQVARSWRPVAIARFDTKGVIVTHTPSVSDQLIVQSVDGQSPLYQTSSILINTRTQSQRELRFNTEEQAGVQNSFFWHCLTNVAGLEFELGEVE